jgi:hypothetical protein
MLLAQVLFLSCVAFGGDRPATCDFASKSIVSRSSSGLRVGHFQVECHILDGDRVMGVGVVEFEVLFKGRFSDVGLPGATPA